MPTDPEKIRIGQEAGKEVADESLAYYESCRRKMQRAFSPAFLTRELKLIAAQDMADFIQVDAQGSVKPKGFDELKPGRSRIIKKIKEKRRILSKEDGDTILEDTFEFELHDKIRALEMGAELAGLKNKNLDISLHTDKPILIISKPSNGKADGNGSETGT